MTTSELEDFLRIDRTTIYHLLKEGKLPGFKVGGQWRFLRQDVEVWLKEQGIGLSAVSVQPSPEILPFDYIQSIQDIFAEAMGVSSIVTGLDGKPLTRISCSCAFCDLILNTPQGFHRCVASWQRMAGLIDRKPQLHRCHAGLLYARSRIEVEDEFIAMVFAGQVVIDGDRKECASRVEELAAACGLAPAQLHEALSSVHSFPSARVEQLMTLLERVGGILSRIGQERLAMLRKLRSIAELSAL